jgi:hypothetical protein
MIVTRSVLAMCGVKCSLPLSRMTAWLPGWYPRAAIIGEGKFLPTWRKRQCICSGCVPFPLHAPSPSVIALSLQIQARRMDKVSSLLCRLYSRAPGNFKGKRFFFLQFSSPTSESHLILPYLNIPLEMLFWSTLISSNLNNTTVQVKKSSATVRKWFTRVNKEWRNSHFILN